MNILSTIATIGKALKEAGKADLQLKLIEVADQVQELQKRCDKLSTENKALREALHLKGKLIYRDEMYFLPREGESVDGPYCTRCYDSDRKLIRLQSQFSSQPHCPQCHLSQGPSKPSNGIGIVRGRSLMSQALSNIGHRY